MRCILFLTITIASLLVSSERVVGGPIGIRMDETIRLGSSYGLMVDMDTAFAQEETLGPIFRSQFQRFKDLTVENVANYTRTYPKEFWAFNNYLRYLYRDGLITANDLSEYRAASVVGLKSYLETQQAHWPTPSPAVTQPQQNTGIDLLTSNGIQPVEDLDKTEQPVAFQQPEEAPAPIPTETPELDRFLEIAKGVASGKTIRDTVESRARDKADATISSEVKSYLSERFKSVRLQGRLFSGESDPEVSLGLVTALSDTDTSTLFNQVDVTARDDDTIASVGLGYRTQIDDSTVVGVNSFIDHDISNDHTRASLGLEWQNTYVSLSANRYFSLSDYQTITKHESQRPAEGYDLDLAVTTPDWPVSVTYRTALWDLDDRGQNRIKAYGLKGDITDGLNVQVENVESSQASTSTVSKLTYTYRFDEDKDASLLPDPSIFESARYRFVDRNQTMPMASEITNQPPIANDSTLSVTTGTSNSIDVTGLISDLDGDPLTTSIISHPSHGSATLSGNVITYSHDGGSARTDSVTYQVEDGYSGSDTGVIAINIQDTVVAVRPSSPGNRAPVASDSTITIAENSSGTIDLSTLISDADGDAMTVSIASPISYGTSILGGTTVTVTPDSSNPSTTDMFTYSVSDGNGGTATGTVTINFDRIYYGATFSIQMRYATNVIITDCDSNSFTTGALNSSEQVPWLPTEYYLNQPIDFTLCVFGQNLADGFYDSGDTKISGPDWAWVLTDNGTHTKWDVSGSYNQNSFGNLYVEYYLGGSRFKATAPAGVASFIVTFDGVIP